jgi:hypothetical protein
VNDVNSCDLLTGGPPKSSIIPHSPYLVAHNIVFVILLSAQCFKALLIVNAAEFPKNEAINSPDSSIYGAIRAREALRFRHN